MCYIDSYGSEICHDTDGWILYGRWILLAAILLVALAIYLIFACITARRRHKAGSKPYMGTSWTLAVNPPAYKSSESLPKYAARNQGVGASGGDLEAQRRPEAAVLSAGGTEGR